MKAFKENLCKVNFSDNILCLYPCLLKIQSLRQKLIDWYVIGKCNPREAGGRTERSEAGKEAAWREASTLRSGWLCSAGADVWSCRIPTSPSRGGTEEDIISSSYPGLVRGDFSHFHEALTPLHFYTARLGTKWVLQNQEGSPEQQGVAFGSRTKGGTAGHASSNVKNLEQPHCQRQWPQECRFFARATQTSMMAVLQVYGDTYIEFCAFCSSTWVILWFNFSLLYFCLQGIHC